MPTFNKKHYIAVAVVLRDTRPPYHSGSSHAAVSKWENITIEFIKTFHNDSEKFDVEKFLSVTGSLRIYEVPTLTSPPDA